MISQNIRFKPIYKRSKTITLPLWVANPLRLCKRLRTKVRIWLSYYSDPTGARRSRTTIQLF